MISSPYSSHPGLDSFNAHNVVKTLLTLARSGRSIIATIHQPNSKITQMFDKLVRWRG